MGLGLIIPVLPKLIEGLAGGVQAGAFYNGIFIAVYALMQFVFAPSWEPSPTATAAARCCYYHWRERYWIIWFRPLPCRWGCC